MNNSAQDTINVEYCLSKSEENHPRKGSRELIEKISTNKVQNARASYYPQVEMNGSASYQSDVVQIGIDLPIPGVKFPVAPKDQYKVSLDISQAIYDGGLSKNRQKLEKTVQETDITQLDLEIHNTKMQVKDLYFDILVLQKNEKALEVALTQLKENYKIIDSYVKNGVALSIDSDLLMVEEINVGQKNSELNNSRHAMLDMLGQKIGVKLDTSVFLEPTSYNLPEDYSINRREQKVMYQQKNNL